MKFPYRPLSVKLCNNNRNSDIIRLSLGKGRVIEVYTNIVITYQLVLDINGKKICVPTENDNLQVYFSQSCDDE